MNPAQNGIKYWHRNGNIILSKQTEKDATDKLQLNASSPRKL